MDAPRELITPEQSQVLALALALAAALIGAAWGWSRGGVRAAVLGGVAGLLIWPAWKAHEWATRFDPSTGRLGLESVWLLLGEVSLAVVLGAALGRLWHHLTGQTRPPEREATEEN